MNQKPLLFIIGMILLASQCAALGIAPSSVDIMFEPGLEKTVQLKVINSAHKDIRAVIYAEGELADAITILTPEISLSAQDEGKIISYTVKLPKTFEKQGEHEGRIVIREIPKQGEGGTSLTAGLAVVSKLRVTVPYEGTYAEAKLFVTSFEENKESNFAVEVQNLGTTDILEAYAIIAIYDPLSSKVATVTSNRAAIAQKGKQILIAKWTPTLGPGNYRAVATVIYDGLNAKDEKPFTIGTFSLDILSISVSNFKLGGIAKFDILVQNNWNEQIPQVYAETAVRDKSGKVYTTFKTASVDIPAHGQQELNAFWDTNKVTTGSYQMNVELNYLAQKTEKVFDIMVDYNVITASAIGMATSGGGEEKPVLMQSISLLIGLVLILIVFNAFIFFKFLRKKS